MNEVEFKPKKNWAINEIVNPEDANRWETGIEEGISKAEEAAKDALTLSNKAKTEAIAEAASDAQTKADQAKSDAITAASADATTKANTAQANAKAYTDEQVSNLSDVVAGVQNYTAFTDIDPTYTNDTLFATVYNAMVNNSILRTQVSANATDYPADGLLEVIKQDANHGACTLSAADGIYTLTITPENIEQIFGGGGVLDKWIKAALEADLAVLQDNIETVNTALATLTEKLEIFQSQMAEQFANVNSTIGEILENLPPVPGAQTWSTPGTYSFTVPPKVTVINLKMSGAASGNAGSLTVTSLHHYEYTEDAIATVTSSGCGSANGFIVDKSVSVTPGQVISVTVGAKGSYVSDVSSTVDSYSNGYPPNGTVAERYGNAGTAGGQSKFGSDTAAGGGAPTAAKQIWTSTTYKLTKSTDAIIGAGGIGSTGNGYVNISWG